MYELQGESFGCCQGHPLREDHDIRGGGFESRKPFGFPGCRQHPQQEP